MCVLGRDLTAIVSSRGKDAAETTQKSTKVWFLHANSRFRADMRPCHFVLKPCYAYPTG